jgi:DNA-binding CsgD family transcriptional regulator
MSQIKTFSMAVSSIYAAASGQARWSVALSAMEEALGATGSHLISWSPITNRAFTSVVNGVDDSAARLYAEHYGLIDPRRIHGERLPQDVVFRCHELFDERFASSNEFYCDYLAKYDVRFLTAATFIREEGTRAHFAALRSKRRGHFAVEDTRVLELLLPHLRQAFRLADELKAGEARSAQVRGILDRLSGPAAILTRDSRVQEVNSEMDRLLNSSGPIVMSGGRLVARRSADAAKLVKAVQLAGAGADPKASGTRLRLDGGEDGALWIATVLPLSPVISAGLEIERHGTLLVLNDLMQRRGVINPAMLQEVLRVSPAEARLAAALAAGETVNDYAERTALSLNTVRSQLKSVFGKINVSSQVELSKALCRLNGDAA